MFKNVFILIVFSIFYSMASEAIDKLISDIEEAAIDDSVLKFEVEKHIENDIDILKNEYNTDTTKIGIALIKAYRIAQSKYYREKNEAIINRGRSVAAYYDSIIQFYEKEQMQLINKMLSTKDSTNLEVIREYFGVVSSSTYKGGLDSSYATYYKLAKRAIQLPGANERDSLNYFGCLCSKKDEAQKECNKFINQKLANGNVSGTTLDIFDVCGSCLEKLKLEEDALKIYIKAHELGTSPKYFETPHKYDGDIKRLQEKIKAKQQKKTGN